jgi:DNA-binding ferritin-like protein
LADSYGNCGERVLAAIQVTDDDGDFVTADLLTGVLADLDKQLWILESHLNR